MTVLDAKEVVVPFGRNNGWPLGSLMDRRFGDFAKLVRQRARLIGDLKEALDELARDPAIAEKLRRYRVQRATQRTNRIHLNKWAWR